MAEELKRKRQTRGEARIQSLLEAAQAVFARLGYSKATTNEIAAQADVSPATLYQFFNNKEEIANALAIKYIEALAQLHQELDYKAMAKLPMREMVQKFLSPLLNFHKMHPAFMALLLDAPLSAETYQRKLAMSANCTQCLSQLLIARNPKLCAQEAQYRAEIGTLLFKGFIGEIQGASGKRKKMLSDSLVDLLAAHLSQASPNSSDMSSDE
jgi:AcrR family transcriptional regulator